MKAVRCKHPTPVNCPHHGEQRANALQQRISKLERIVGHPQTSNETRLKAHNRLQKLSKYYNATDKGYRGLIQKLTYSTNLDEKVRVKQLLTEASILRTKQEPENTQTTTGINAVVAVLTDDLNEPKTKQTYRQYQTGITNRTFLVETLQGTKELLVNPNDKSAWHCPKCGIFITLKNETLIKTNKAYHNITCEKCNDLIYPDGIKFPSSIKEDQLRFIENDYLTQNSTWYLQTETTLTSSPTEMHLLNRLALPNTFPKGHLVYRVNFPQATQINPKLYNTYKEINPEPNTIYRILDNVLNPGTISLYAYMTKPKLVRIENPEH